MSKNMAHTQTHCPAKYVATINWNESHQKATHFINGLMPEHQSSQTTNRAEDAAQTGCQIVSQTNAYRPLDRKQHFFLSSFSFILLFLATNIAGLQLIVVKHMLLAYWKILHNNNESNRKLVCKSSCNINDLATHTRIHMYIQ